MPNPLPFARPRAATAADLPLLCHAEGVCFPDAWSEEQLRAHLLSPTSCTLLLPACDGTLAAYLCGSFIAPEAEVYRIATLPAYRRSGAARSLLTALLEQPSLESCYLEVRASNSGAYALYTAAGFCVYGRRRDYYAHPTEDALLMLWEKPRKV